MMEDLTLQPCLHFNVLRKRESTASKLMADRLPLMVPQSSIVDQVANNVGARLDHSAALSASLSLTHVRNSS